jgi:hypothetical protein
VQPGKHADGPEHFSADIGVADGDHKEVLWPYLTAASGYRARELVLAVSKVLGQLALVAGGAV